MNSTPVVRLSMAVAFATATASPLLAQARGETAPVQLKYGSFDPGVSTPVVPIMLRGSSDTNLWIVQFEGLPTDEMRSVVRASGGEIHSYLPENAYVVRMPHHAAADVQRSGVVRSVTYYHPAFRLEEFLRAESTIGTNPTRRYNVVLVDKRRDKPALAGKIQAIEGQVNDLMEGSLLMQATLSGPQLFQVARFDEVLWIDRWGAPEDDMDNARIQGGANYIETAGGYTGKGIIGHQYEGLNTNHNDWTNTPIGFPAGCTASSGHGHNTAGIVYGNGTSHPTARGMAPDAQAYFTSCRNNRWANFNTLVNTHNIMFTTASWGSPRTRDYTSVSAEADDICFDHDLVWTNSQSNASNQDSRAEAWAKNVFACGGVAHRNNSNPADDSWQAGGASIGPARDGRTKPDFTAYYDNIATSSSNGSYTTSFGGTSGATPIVAGHNALAIQMFTDGVFGNVLRKPGGTRFENKPRFPTLKALQMANASQYPFTSTSTDNRRNHQGYGFPNLRSMWDNRNVMFIVDETDVITQGNGVAYTLAVPAGRNELKISMTFADPAGNPASRLARINDLSLRVTAPNGTRYWGNAGLEDGNYSTSGGSRDRINTAENVFVRSPAAGNWIVEVIAYSVVQDSHVETRAVDADYGLVANGATFVSKRAISVQVGSTSSFGQSCIGSGKLPSYCISNNASGGSSTRQTRQWEYAYRVQSTNAVTVTGFELWTGTSSGGTVTVPVAFYTATAGGAPNLTAIRRSTMSVSGAEGFYKATFTPAINVAANTTFYVSMSHNNQTFISSVSGGAAGPGYYRSSANTWTLSGIATRSSYRILCAGGSQNAAPELSVEGNADIGEELVYSVRLARPNALAIMFIGASDSSWSGGNLPYNLRPLGAPTCNLYVSLNANVSLRTDGSGNAGFSATIPNDSSLIGAQAFQQVVVDDPPANAAGLVTTNAIKVVVGG